MMDWNYFDIPYQLSDLTNGVKSIFMSISPIILVFLGLIVGFYVLRNLIGIFR